MVSVKITECFSIFTKNFLGEVVNRPHWGKDQPNNYNGEQNCVVLDGGREWLWNDVGCNLDYLSWICQYGKGITFISGYSESHERILRCE